MYIFYHTIYMCINYIIYIYNNMSYILYILYIYYIYIILYIYILWIIYIYIICYIFIYIYVCIIIFTLYYIYLRTVKTRMSDGLHNGEHCSGEGVQRGNPNNKLNKPSPNEPLLGMVYGIGFTALSHFKFKSSLLMANPLILLIVVILWYVQRVTVHYCSYLIFNKFQ